MIPDGYVIYAKHPLLLNIRCPPCGMLAQWNSAPWTSAGGFHRASLFLQGQVQILTLEILNVFLPALWNAKHIPPGWLNFRLP